MPCYLQFTSCVFLFFSSLLFKIYVFRPFSVWFPSRQHLALLPGSCAWVENRAWYTLFARTQLPLDFREFRDFCYVALTAVGQPTSFVERYLPLTLLCRQWQGCDANTLFFAWGKVQCCLKLSNADWYYNVMSDFVLVSACSVIFQLVKLV